MNQATIAKDPNRLTVVNAEGVKIGQISPPTELPSDILPGEAVTFVGPNGKHLHYLVCDKERWWSDGRWNIGGSVIEYDPATLPEDKLYELRRSLLKHFGWIG